MSARVRSCRVRPRATDSQENVDDSPARHRVDICPADELPGEAARALFRLNLPTEVAGCTLESATLRLYQEQHGRSHARAVPIAEAWNEQTLTWATQPATAGPPASAVAGQGGGYLRWDVTTQVAAAHNGFLIRDASEGGGGFEQQFHSKKRGTGQPAAAGDHASGRESAVHQRRDTVGGCRRPARGVRARKASRARVP